jgi:hypothetical protein
MGVKTVVIPRKGKPNAARREVQARRSFRKLVKWRTGVEGGDPAADRLRVPFADPSAGA